MIENYDPNSMFGKTTWRLTFKRWDYELVIVRAVGGNCKGLSTLEFAIEEYIEDLFQDGQDFVEIELTNPNGEVLSVDLGEEGCPEEELKDMLVKAELVSVLEYKTYTIY